MSLKKYRALLEAVECGSLTRAAEKLHYTQPGISHMILSLEEEFGFPLLSRGKSGVTPTPECRELHSLSAIPASDCSCMWASTANSPAGFARGRWTLR